MADSGSQVSDLLFRSGGTMTGTLELAGDPTNANDAANKSYVDSAVGTAVQSVSGTTNRITSTGGLNPVIDISASYIGQTSITTLGTIATGTWNGTAIGTSNGGTGLTSAGSSGNILTSDGTNWTSAAPTSTFTPNSLLQISEDFLDFISITSSPTPLRVSQLGWFNGNDNFTTNASLVESGHPGIITNVSMASTTTNAIILGTTLGAPRSFILGGGELSINWVIKIATLSTVTNRYILRFGLGDTVTNVDQANGVYWEYSDNINSGNWVGKTASASSPTSANSNNAADTNWHNFGIIINAGATSVSYYIDGVQITNSPITNTIPTAIIAPFVNIYRTAGTVAANSLVVDLMYLTQTLTSAR